MEDAQEERSENRVRVLVEGACEVNGVYEWVDSSDNDRDIKWARHGIWEKEECQFLIYRRLGIRTSRTSWFISRTTAGKQIEKECIYYEATAARDDDQGFPPKTNWLLHRFGESPAPVLSILPPKPISNLLLSRDFSDVKFVCPDGQAIPAHRNILAAASPYFRAAFSGPWKNNQEGELKTVHSAQVVKAVLTMMYTGTVKSALDVKKDPLSFLSIASEYDLPWLQKIAKDECASSLDADNLKQIWQAHRLYDCSTLKSACINYAKKNAVSVMLSDCSITGLQAEDPQSWKDFAEALDESNGGKRKRADN